MLTLNGFYLSDAFRTSRALFWLLDALQFVVVPAVSLRRGDRFRGLPAIFLRARVYPALSAAAFALIHWESGSREVIATFLLGVVSAALSLRIRNLWPFVAGHAITDMLTFTGPMRTEKDLYVLLVGLAVGAWVLPWLLLGNREAWDHWSYFAISMPAMCAAAAYAGYRARNLAWRWPLTLVLAQFAAAVLTTGEFLLIAIVAFALFAMPMMIATALGAWLARRRTASG